MTCRVRLAGIAAVQFLGGGRVADAVQKYHSEDLTVTPAGEWARILGQLKAEIGDDAFRNWLRPINLERVESGQATVTAPTRFLRDWVTTHYADRLLALWRSENERMTRLSIVVGEHPRYMSSEYPAEDRGDPVLIRVPAAA